MYFEMKNEEKTSKRISQFISLLLNLIQGYLCKHESCNGDDVVGSTKRMSRH
jgi:hypothetical protein